MRTLVAATLGASLTFPLMPLGRAKTPFSAPRLMARLTRVVVAWLSSTLKADLRYLPRRVA